MQQLLPEERLDAWWDGAAMCVIAAGTHGDPLDLSPAVRALIEKLRQCLMDAE